MYSYKYWIFIKLFFCWIFLSTANKKEFGERLNEDECKLCKLLTDSFEHWMDKTSRGKYEGGDAAWEESKLKSYSKSEVRLVEIQEGMCSELKTQQDALCYKFNERVEQHIEQWWSNDDLRGSNIYTWLCITTLQHCCPKSHYGKNCDSCKHIKNNKVCNGYGHCDGDGTRNGNGSCICYKGYEGVECEHCSEYYFRNTNGACDACHLSCETCSGIQQSDCKSCKIGWDFNSNGECVDIDECADTTVCNSNEYCKNTIGSYECRTLVCYDTCKTCSGPLPNECLSCKDQGVWAGGWCLDKNQLYILERNMGMYIVSLLFLRFVFYRASKLTTFLIALIVFICFYIYEIQANPSTFNILYHYYFP